VTRYPRSSNHYRLDWPEGHHEKPHQEQSNVDNSVSDAGQICPPNRDRNVSQSYLKNPLKSYSSGTGEGKPSKRRFADQGTYERRIAERYGPETWDILAELDPAVIEELCKKEKDGQLDASDIAAARLAVAQTKRRV
jgi:hypothetical protein